MERDRPPSPNGPNLRLRSLIEEAGWTQEAFARSVNAMAARHALATHYDRTSVSHWLTGTRPRPPAPQLICQALTQRLGRLVPAVSAGLTDLSDLSDHGLLADPIAHLIALTDADTDPRRRATTHSPLFEISHPLPAPPETRVPAQRGPPGHPPWTTVIGALDEMTRIQFSHLESLGGEFARVTLATYLGTSVAPWLHAAAPEPERTDLLSAATRLIHLLAQMCADAGLEGQSQRYHYAALQLASRAGDRVLYAVELRALSAQAGRLGHRAAALRLAVNAAQLAEGHAPPTVRAYLHAQLAVAQARAGQGDNAVQSLTRAERFLDQPAGVAGPFTRYSPAAFAYQRAQVLHALGEPQHALACLTASLRLRGPEEHRARALTWAAIAELHCATGNLEEACAHWDRCMGEAPSGSAQVRQRIVRMHSDLRPFHRAASVRDLLARAPRTSTPIARGHTHAPRPH